MLQLARNAYKLWGLGDAKLVLVAQRENTTFKVNLVRGPHYALRLHRPGYRSHSQLRAELVWMQYLRDQGLAVPTPVESAQGQLLEQIGGYQVSLLLWLKGQPMGQSGQHLALQNAVQTLYSLGQCMAGLHQTSDVWSGAGQLDRPHWGVEGLLGDQPLWGPFWHSPQLTNEQAALFLKVRSELRVQLQQWQSQLDYGLIHADLVRENVLLNGAQPQLIDFDDSGYGFRLFELATCLLANANEPNYDQLKQQMIAGYRSVRPLDIRHLDAFMLIRALTYVGWVMPRLEEEGGYVRCQRFIQRAVSMSQKYIG